MRRYCVLLAVLLTGIQAASAALLWDNFTTGVNGFDGKYYFTSERNPTIPIGSWTADDATFTEEVTVDSLRWAGAYLPGNYNYRADVVILREDWSELASYTDLSYTTLGTYQLIDVYRSYKAEVQIPQVNLPAGTYFFGIRLTSTDGRNMMLSTGHDPNNLNAPPTIGGSVGLIKAPDFGYNNWIKIEDFYGLGLKTDYAFQVYGVVVPEPASLTVLAVGLLAFLTRRR